MIRNRLPTALYTHAACLQHDTGPGHPERIQRLDAILRVLDDPLYGDLLRCEAPEASRAQLERVHTHAYVEEVFAAIPGMGRAEIDGDTVLSPGSGGAALRAAGAVTAAVGAVMQGKVKNAFCAVRPPGHHAERDLAMGFCIFNNVAVGAAEALDAYNLKRVAIIDFDVHHGNGTQHIFAQDPRVLYVSSHQMPLYPGTGARHEKGVGNICNAPLARDGGDCLAGDRALQAGIPADLGWLRRTPRRSLGGARARDRGLHLDHRTALRPRG